MTTATEIPVHPETGEPLEDIAARIHADHAHLQGLKADPDIQARLQARGVSIDALIIKPVETVAVRLVDLDATA